MIEQRLARLEKSNRRLRLGIATVAVAGMLPYVLAATNVLDVFQATEVRTQKITLLSGGTEVGVIKPWLPDSTDTAHKPGVGFYGPDGSLRASIQDARSGGDLHVYDKAGGIAATIYADTLGGVLRIMNMAQRNTLLFGNASTGGYIGVYNNDLKRAASMLAGTDGGEIRVGDTNGNVRTYLGMTAPDVAALELKDSADHDLARVASGGPNDPGGFLRLKNAANQEIGYLGSTKQGSSMLTLSEAGKDAIQLGYNATESYFNMGRNEKYNVAIASKPDNAFMAFYNSADKGVVSLGAFKFEDESGLGSGKLLLWDEAGTEIGHLGAFNGRGGVLSLKNASGNSVVYAGAHAKSEDGDLYQGGKVVVYNRSGEGVAFMEGNYTRGRFCTGAPAAPQCAWNSPIN